MSRNDLASTESNVVALHPDRLDRLIAAMEALATASSSGPSSAELELKCFTPQEAAPLHGKTVNWVVEAIQDRRIPFTYIGKSPRLTAAHIRQIQACGETRPSKYAKSAA